MWTWNSGTLILWEVGRGRLRVEVGEEQRRLWPTWPMMPQPCSCWSLEGAEAQCRMGEEEQALDLEQEQEQEQEQEEQE